MLTDFFSQQIEAISQFENKLPFSIRERLYVSKVVLWPNSGSKSFIRKLTVSKTIAYKNGDLHGHFGVVLRVVLEVLITSCLKKINGLHD